MPSVDLVSPLGAFSPAAVGDGVTNDAPAFRAFNDWAQAQVSPITLTLGTGSKNFLLTTEDTNPLRGNSLAYNVHQPLLVLGNGHATTTMTNCNWMGSIQSMKAGNGNFGNVNHWTARLNFVNAGSSSVICKTPADTAQFVVNTWALITGLDMQKGGQPPNPAFFEYVFITAINAGTGQITFQSPLVNTYRDDWPNYDGGTPGGEPDQGGPATLYAFDGAWDIDVTFQGFTVNNSGETLIKGRSVQFIDVKTVDPTGIIPSLNKFVSFTGCNLVSAEMEFDKLVSKAVFDSTSAHLKFQSNSNEVVVQNGCSVTFNGTPRFLTVDASTITSFLMGAAFSGFTELITITNSTFTDIQYIPVRDIGEITSTGVDADYTMTGNVISFPYHSTPYGPRWAVPGQWCFWGNSTTDYGPLFQVQSVTGDASFAYITVSSPNGFPTNGFPGSGLAIHGHPCLHLAVSNCTGGTDAVNLSNASASGFSGNPARTFSKTALNGTNLGLLQTGKTITLPRVTGTLVSYTIDVQTPYTGPQGALTWNALSQFNNGGGFKSDYTLANWFPQINLNTPGKRVITPAGVTGTQMGDSGLALPINPLWFDGPGTIGADKDISAEAGANGPVFVVTIIMDQGTTQPKISQRRFRLH